MAPDAIHVLLADDHAMVRDGMRRLIQVDWPQARFTEVPDAAGALAALERRPAPDLALIDVRMPGMRGVESFTRFRRAADTPIVVVTGLDDPGLPPTLLASGAARVVSKEAPGEELLAVLHAVLAHAPPAPQQASPQPAAAEAGRGSHGLSERQRDMLRLLHEGLPNKLIARRLAIEETTVKGHLHGLYRLLEVRGRTEAVALTRDWLL